MRTITPALASVIIALIMPVSAHAQSICLWNCLPTEAHARSVFDNMLKKATAPAPVQVLQFSKSNGREQTVFGTRIYEMEFSAEVHLPEGLRPQCVSNGRGGFAGGERVYWECFQANVGSIAGLSAAPRGAKSSINGKLVFEKTEKGWRGQDGNIY